MVMTDEYDIYAKLPEWGYGHKTVCHSKREFARDDLPPFERRRPQPIVFGPAMSRSNRQADTRCCVVASLPFFIAVVRNPVVFLRER